MPGTATRARFRPGSGSAPRETRRSPRATPSATQPPRACRDCSPCPRRVPGASRRRRGHLERAGGRCDGTALDPSRTCRVMRPRDGAPQVTMYWDALDRSLVAPDEGGFDPDLDGQRRTREDTSLTRPKGIPRQASTLTRPRRTRASRCAATRSLALALALALVPVLIPRPPPPPHPLAHRCAVRSGPATSASTSAARAPSRSEATSSSRRPRRCSGGPQRGEPSPSPPQRSTSST